MTPRESFIHALERRTPIPGGRVPHFELVFFLTMEAFGKVHPSHRTFGQWDQFSPRERELHRKDIAQLYIDTARRYGHSAIFVHPWQGAPDEELGRLVKTIRNLSGDEFFLMVHGDATMGLPSGNAMDAVCRLYDQPEDVIKECDARVDAMIRRADEHLSDCGLDGFALCSDYCFNTGPWMSPELFRKFITPFLTRLTRAYRDRGFYVIKHTDGNIMPILDQLLESNPHALHSLDPQGGVDIAEVKRLAGDRICLIGNVNCGLLDTGTDEQCTESARYAFKAGMSGGGYIFSTSNCIYSGMPLARYDLIRNVWRKEGVYPG